MQIKQIDNEDHLMLDFDGSAYNVVPNNYLQILDDLYNLIIDEYEKTIKEPVLNHMRKKSKGPR